MMSTLIALSAPRTKFQAMLPQTEKATENLKARDIYVKSVQQENHAREIPNLKRQ